MARKLIGVLAAAALALTACSAGTAGTPAAPAQTSQAVVTSTSSAPTTTTSSSRASSSSSVPRTTERSVATVTVTALTSNTSAGVPTDEIIVVNGKAYVCDDVFVSFNTYCNVTEQNIWDVVAYYNPTGFETFLTASVQDNLVDSNELIVDGMSLGLLACEAYFTAPEANAETIGRANFQAFLSTANPVKAGQVYDYALQYICGA